MAQTQEGGIKARDSIKEKHGPEFYKMLGSIGGKTAHKINPETGKALKGFAVTGQAAKFGKRGGKASVKVRRQKAKELAKQLKEQLKESKAQ